jgi:hypothetical protein
VRLLLLLLLLSLVSQHAADAVRTEVVAPAALTCAFPDEVQAEVRSRLLSSDPPVQSAGSRHSFS